MVIFDLRNVERDLNAQLSSIETLTLLLEDDRRDLRFTKAVLQELLTNTVVSTRDYQELRCNILEYKQRIEAQETQLNAQAGYVVGLRKKLEDGHREAEIMMSELKSLGKVLPWKKT
jgi:hypothetical protein